LTPEEAGSKRRRRRGGVGLWEVRRRRGLVSMMLLVVKARGLEWAVRTGAGLRKRTSTRRRRRRRSRCCFSRESKRQR
jgi:hypothetical protein